jgi:lipopolysaccharide/colanic/teichoic acid biosynthesis glycosyltransferase
VYKKYIKRLLDVIFAFVLLPPVLLIILISGLFIKLEDGGPIFYFSERLGKNGKIFKMYKLRTMKVNAPDLRNEDGSTYNSEDDPRLTKVGRILRKSSIDELPQIFNVLKGEMSFIGPRPDLPDHLNYYEGDEIRKLEVLPGITGFNQAYYRNTIEWKKRLKNDVYYVENLTFFLDFKILIKTIEAIILRKGVYVSYHTNDVEEGGNESHRKTKKR